MDSFLLLVIFTMAYLLLRVATMLKRLLSSLTLSANLPKTKVVLKLLFSPNSMREFTPFLLVVVISYFPLCTFYYDFFATLVLSTLF